MFFKLDELRILTQVIKMTTKSIWAPASRYTQVHYSFPRINKTITSSFQLLNRFRFVENEVLNKFHCSFKDRNMRVDIQRVDIRAASCPYHRAKVLISMICIGLLVYFMTSLVGLS